MGCAMCKDEASDTIIKKLLVQNQVGNPVHDVRNQLEIKKYKNAKENWDWGKDIIVIPLQNLIKVELPSLQKFHLDKKDINQFHIYLFERKTGLQQPVQDIKSNRFDAGGFTINFKPGNQVKKQEYDYIFAFEINQPNQIIKVKKNTIIIHGKIGPQPLIKFKKNDSNSTEIQLNQKVDQIKQNGLILNILILGRVALGKSSYISNYMRMLNQLYGFQHGKLPGTADADRTNTKQFGIHSLKYRNQMNKNECRINLIDGPGLGGQLKDMSTTEFSNIYCDALNLLLNGELDYKKFNISKQINVQAAKQEQDPNKIIHYCIIFIRPSDTNEVLQMIKKITTLITESEITYGLVINRSDEYLVDDLPTPQLINKIKHSVRQQGYKVQGEGNIFSTCLSQKYFPQIQIFYEQFQNSIYFSLSYAIQQIQNNIVNIYLQQNNTQKYIQMVRITNTMTLQQFFITSIKYFKKREIKDIDIKYQGKYRNISGIIHDQDPDEEDAINLLYYKTRVNNRWKIVFKLRNTQKQIK